MNKRFGKVVKVHKSYAVVLPVDWCRGNEINGGSEVEICYDGVVKISPRKGQGAVP